MGDTEGQSSWCFFCTCEGEKKSLRNFFGVEKYFPVKYSLRKLMAASGEALFSTCSFFTCKDCEDVLV